MMEILGLKISAAVSANFLLILIVNLIPVYGVLYWDWQGFDLLFLYWLENWIVGFFMILRLVIHRYQGVGDVIGTILTMPFTAFHYSAFCIGHGIFILVLFKKIDGDPLVGMWSLVISLVQTPEIMFALAGLLLTHFIRWIKTIIKAPFYPGPVIGSAYGRILLTHLTIFACAFGLFWLGSSEFGLLFLVLVKLAIDLILFRREIITKVSLD
jgi:Family of unknown function (DUF6498)